MQNLFKPKQALLALAIVLTATLTYGQTQSGTLDATFGTGGKVTTAFGASAAAISVAVQPDGKIVATGNVSSPSGFDFALSRYNIDGTLDLSFGIGGKVTTIFAGQNDLLSSVAIQQDGKIIVAGRTLLSLLSNFALARYNSNGTLDASFGTGGKVITAFGQVSAQAFSVVVQQDGKIVVAGVANIDGGEDFALVRYNSNGTLDAGFGTGGKVTTDFGLVGQGSFAFASAVAVQLDGRIVAAGDARINGGRNFALARYNSNGTLDASFGAGGKVTNIFSGSGFDDFANSVAVQPDGKIVAAGGATISGGLDFGLVRYNSDGTLDATFGTSGKVTTNFASTDFALSVAIQQDGSIVAAGRTGPDNNSFHSALARYNANGTLDASFGTSGKVTNIFGGQRDVVNSLAIQQDGKIVAAGGVTDFNGNAQFALARYLNVSSSPTPTPSPTATPTPSPSTTENVSWTNVVGATASGNTLTKTAATAWGNAGASSTRSIVSGDGYVEFRITSSNTGMVGLSHTDANPDYSSIDFALFGYMDGSLYVYESGIFRGPMSSFTTADVFRVAVEGGVIKYRKNGTLIYTSTVAPTYPLLGDTALYVNGGSFTNAVLSGNLTGGAITGGATENVTWANVVGATASGNSLTKTAPTAWGNAGASSTKSIVSGDGYVEFKVTSLLTGMVGLSHSDPNQDYTSMEFALLTGSDGNLYVYESGVNRGLVSSYTTADVFRVAVEGGVVKYRKNGILVYTSSVAPTYPLLVDAGLYFNGGTQSNVVISGNLSAGATRSINWRVTDGLGTLAMTIAQSGRLGGPKRHDYLSFGKR
ncbi:MAG TPA: delta-60 repeat domain-containing protein [Pyrinomonadaceae bacterium]